MRQQYVVLNNYLKQPFIDYVENCFSSHPQAPGCDARDKKNNVKLSELNEESRNCYIKTIMHQHAGFNRIQNELLVIINSSLMTLCVDIYQSLHSIQYAVYESGSMYKPHVDSMSGDTLWCKKITAVALLSDNKEFTGGEFLLNNQPVLSGKGSVVIFPSYMVHSVTPIQSGIRKTLATWVIGPQWK